MVMMKKILSKTKEIWTKFSRKLSMLLMQLECTWFQVRFKQWEKTWCSPAKSREGAPKFLHSVGPRLVLYWRRYFFLFSLSILPPWALVFHGHLQLLVLCFQLHKRHQMRCRWPGSGVKGNVSHCTISSGCFCLHLSLLPCSWELFSATRIFFSYSRHLVVNEGHVIRRHSWKKRVPAFLCEPSFS